MRYTLGWIAAGLFLLAGWSPLSAQVVAPIDVVCLGADEQSDTTRPVDVTWENGSDYDEVIVSVNGVVTAELAGPFETGDLSTYRTPDQPIGETVDVSVEGVVGDESDESSCSLEVLNAARFGIAVESNGPGSVQVRVDHERFVFYDIILMVVNDGPPEEFPGDVELATFDGLPTGRRARLVVTGEINGFPTDAVRHTGGGDADGDGVCDDLDATAPSGVDVTVEGDVTTVVWTNNDTYSGISVRVDEEEVASLDGAATSFDFVELDPGCREFVVVGIVDQLACEARSIPFLVDCVEETCTDFDDETPQGWTAIGTTSTQYITGPSGAATDFAYELDDLASSTVSMGLLGPADYLGDYTKLARSGCAVIEFDSLIVSTGTGGNPQAVRLSIQDSATAPTLRAVFQTSFTHPVGSWFHVAAPIDFESGGVLPSNAFGQWVMTIGTNADWNTLISNVGQVRLHAELVTGPFETVAFDNICITDECPCVDVRRVRRICNDDGTVTVEVFFLNNSGVDVHYVLLPPTPSAPATSTATFSPNVIPMIPAVADGSTGSFSFTIDDPPYGQELCFDFILADEDVAECCHFETCIRIPRCIRRVDELACDLGSDSIVVTWLNPDPYTDICVFVNGTLETELPGTATSVEITNTFAAGDAVVICIVPKIDDRVADETCCLVEIPLVMDDPTFERGDCNGDSVVFAILDALYLLEFGFTGGPPPPCDDAADCDDDGAVFPILDALYLLSWGFTGGPPPPAPLGACGPDPTADTLDCATLSDDCL